MMHLKLPNYPQEFVDAYIKFMISKYIDSVVSRYFVRIIKNNFREDEIRRYIFK